MKKLFFLFIIGWGFFFFKTNGFKYMNGELSEVFRTSLIAITILLIVITVCWIVSGTKFFKSLVDNTDITPFE